jgi:histidine triad (HIT) family protein
MNGCLFCDIVARKLPADIIKDDGVVLAIRDVNPQAPTHVLLMPYEHIASAAELTLVNDALWARLLHVAQEVAVDDGVARSGYRLVTNVGRDGGQTVAHLHVHLLGGRPMSWPPG